MKRELERKVNMTLQWNEQFRVNVKNLNNQHKRLIDMINELHNAMRTGKTHDVLGKTLNALSDYTRYHFGEEENLMITHGYPDSALHKSQHDDFISKLRDCIEKYEAGRITVSVELMNFLRDWFNNHIMGTDKNYSRFLNDKGVQ